MILSKVWLNEFVEISNISTQKISDTLNSLGLEVERVEDKRVVDNVVVGYVKECTKHPNADKLNICKVDVGTKILQIVCGAKNVKQDIFVAVSKVGAILPDGMEIKEASLRGEDSSGMICSSNELGFAPINDGIMILDDSIGELIIGKQLNQYDIFNDTIIDIDITPNRGDCLSILGVARDLACAFDKTLKNIQLKEPIDSKTLSMHKAIKIEFNSDISAHLRYKLIKSNSLVNNLYIDLMYSHINSDTEQTHIQKLLGYITHSTGVILNTYNIGNINSENIIELEVLNNEQDLSVLKFKDSSEISTIGVKIKKSTSKLSKNWILLESSYETPTKLCQNVSKNKVKYDSDIYFKSSRGSNPDISFGIDYFLHIIQIYNLDFDITGGYIQTTKENKTNTIICSHYDINSIIGSNIELSDMSKILNSLYIHTDIDFISKDLIIKIPTFRHDITSLQDIAEEILRVTGIDNIKPKPLVIQQLAHKSVAFNRYIFNKDIKIKCINTGFFENISFIFTSKEIQKNLGLEVCNKSIDIVNPITKDLDTLRSSIIPNLLQAVKLNKNNNFHAINLFEIGSIFDKHRNENYSLAFISSGLEQKPNILNNAKPKMVNFYSFADKIRNILGDIRLEPISKITNKLINPYQSATVWIGDERVGYISKLHSQIQKDMKIDDTFIGEFNMKKLFELKKLKVFTKISKFPIVYRDLSLVTTTDINYLKIKNIIDKLNIPELKEFSPIDIFKLQDDKVSISIRFQLQSYEKTLEEEDINAIVMNKIYKKLSSSLKLELRA
jgi:phenylalanyl-tRNA synthetase beta chain